MNTRTFQNFTRMIYVKSGIKLGAGKEALVHARIRKRMTALRIADFQDYYEYVSNDAGGTEMVELLNSISTNVTHFFRENRHFELLSEICERWHRAGQTRYRLWSAASSTGEECYSMAMTLTEVLPKTADIKLLATDLSTKVLAKAREGLYEARHLETVPRAYCLKYFEREGDHFRVAERLRKLVTFGRINLATPPFPLHGPLDVVFCRNVMIYFDNAVRTKLLAEIFRLLKPGGYLMVGHAESLSGMLSSFKSLESSVYLKPE